MYNCVAKTLHGLEEILAGELRDINAENISKGRRVVGFSGDLEMIYRANYKLSTALSILRTVKSFNISKAADLYSRAVGFPWENIMAVGQTFMIVPVVNSALFKHTGYPALLLKDAIADRFRKKFGRRPSVDQSKPDIVLNCHISGKEVNISLDSTVIPLFKRGYRKYQSQAPLNEVLAAGIVRLSGWDKKTPLLDPMCGSGTLAIEAALFAKNIPPGKYRDFFGFMNWHDYDRDLFIKIMNEAKKKEKDECPEIICRDVDRNNINISNENIRSAGLGNNITVRRADFLDKSTAGGEYFIIMNPPYGERIDTEDIEGLYAGIGERLKHAYPGSQAWLLSSNMDAVKKIGLRTSEKLTLYNGKLEVKLLKYQLFKGSIKKK